MEVRKDHIPVDLLIWQVRYTNGQIVSELDTKYSALDRANIAAFIVSDMSGNPIVEFLPPPGYNGNNLIYRRRTFMVQEAGDRQVLFIIGWGPKGPAYAIGIVNDQILLRESKEGFIVGDSELYPPMPFPGEPELIF